MTINFDHLPTAMSDWLDTLSNTKTPSQAGVLINHSVLATSATLAPSHLRGPVRECYTNTVRALTTLLPDRTTTWRYCEGYAFKPKYGAPIEHAWLVATDGRVWETTWSDVEDVTYLGLPFDSWDFVDALEESEHSLLFGDWARDFRLLRSHDECCPGRKPATLSNPAGRL